MGEFFRGWRRKIGVVTLLMALVFVGGWVRSHTTIDHVTFYSGTNRFEVLSSMLGSIRWARKCGPCEVMPKWFEWESFLVAQMPVDKKAPAFAHWHAAPQMIWYFRLWEIDIGILPFRSRSNQLTNSWPCDVWFGITPYWAVAVPMTLISLWLFLSKPRKSNQTKLIEPVPETVA